MKRIVRWSLPALLLATMIVSGSPVRSDELAAAGRDIVAKSQDAVITLEVVTKSSMSMFGEESVSEDKNETIAVVIDPSGLAVTSLASINLMEFMSDSMGSIVGDSESKATSEITSAKYLLPGGQTMPAQIVLRDKDLDLAFFRPQKTPDKPLAALDLKQSAAPALLDQVATLSRLGAVGNRSVAVNFNRIQAIIDKPRTFFVIEDVATFGTTIFTLDGKLVGMVTIRKLPKGASATTSLFNPGILPVVVPAATIAEVAEQAPAHAKKP